MIPFRIIANYMMKGVGSQRFYSASTIRQALDIVDREMSKPYCRRVELVQTVEVWKKDSQEVITTSFR